MLPENLSPIDLLAIIAAFGLVVAVWSMAILLWRRHRQIENQKVHQRLGLADNAPGERRVLRLWHEGQEVTTSVPGLGRRRPLTQRIEALCRDIGLELSATMFIVLSLVGAAVMILIGLALTGTVLSGLALIFAAAISFWVFSKQKLSKRQALMERQLVEALQITVRSLRAGHPLVGAFRLISEDTEPPIGPLFATICQEQAMGMSLEQAIRRAAENSNNADMKLFATSVAIQMRSGGNLADMMTRLANVIRERIRLNRRLRILLAQTQLSKRILIAMPFVLLLVLLAINPGYVEPLHTMAVGQVLLGIAGLSLLMGAWLINRLANVEY